MVTIDGDRLLRSGRPTTLFGFRVGSAPLRDDWTDELVAQFPLWREHGVNALTIWVQGTSGGFIRALREDGTVDSRDEPIRVRVNFGGSETITEYGRASGEQTLARCRRIVDEARSNEMVVLLGLFYRPALAADDTVAGLEAGACEVAARFAGCDNIIYNVFNEPESRRELEAPEALRAYMRAVAEGTPGRLVGTGYRPSGENPALAAMDEARLIMMDTGNGLENSISEFEALRDCGKPVMNVESFAGNGGGYLDDPERSVSADGGAWVDFEGWRRYFGAWREQDAPDARGRMGPALAAVPTASSSTMSPGPLPAQDI